jgi:hypothetical protein
MTRVGLDVHARSAHAAAIEVVSGELRRVRFGPGTEGVVSWLADLAAPVRAAYEAGPTGFGLARAASAVGVQMLVAAPSKTPRAKGDRVKSDRKDADLLARLLLAGQLKPVVVPPDWLEAIRHLARMREQVRRDLARARHRVSMLLVEGRVYPERPPGTGATISGWLRSDSRSSAPSWRSSVCSRRSTGCSLAGRRWMNGSPASRPMSGYGQPSHDSGRFAESTRSPRWPCISSSAATGTGSPLRESSRAGWD